MARKPAAARKPDPTITAPPDPMKGAQALADFLSRQLSPPLSNIVSFSLPTLGISQIEVVAASDAGAPQAFVGWLVEGARVFASSADCRALGAVFDALADRLDDMAPTGEGGQS